MEEEMALRAVGSRMQVEIEELKEESCGFGS